MAIEKMKKVTVISTADRKSELLDDLMWLSAVDVNPLSDKLEDEEWGNLIKCDGEQTIVEKIAKKVSVLEHALKIYRPISTEKRSLFTPFHELSREDFDNFMSADNGVVSAAEEAIKIEAELIKLKNEENNLDSLKKQLLPWVAIPSRLNEKISQHTSFTFGSLPLKRDLTQITDGELKISDENGEEHSVKAAAWTEELSCDKELKYYLIVYLSNQEQSLFNALSEFGFNRISFPELRGTVSDNIKTINDKKEDIAEKRQELNNKLNEYAKRLSDTEKAIDILSNEKRLFEVREKVLLTQSAFMLEGWTPAERMPDIVSLCEKYGAYLIEEDPKPDEEPPIKLKNHKLVEPFETVTEMYSLPIYRGIDPDFLIAPFYFVFFGVMLSDAGYGLLLALGCFFALKKMNLRGSLRKMVKMFMFGGISTVVWGLLFGSFFGDAVGVISQTFFSGSIALKPIWFDPVSDPITLLVVSFIMGYIHIMVGLGTKMYLLIRDKDYVSAVCDIGFWMILLIGLPLFLVNSTVAAVISIIGALGLVFTQGRNKKGIFGKVIGGVGSLYGITGYFSDLLSYSRILALGLSAGVIGSVFNKLGSLGGKNIIGVILFIVIFTLGHLLNLALSTLSAYVHTSRLQFIEFFSKFYESGGRAFNELGVHGEYSDIVLTKNNNKK